MKQFLKATIFCVTLVALAGLAYGLYTFHFSVKPEIIKGFIAKAAPPPATVAATKAETESWTPSINAIGSARAWRPRVAA